MDLFGKINDRETKLAPILERYKDQKHPLDCHNLYQLVIMVVLFPKIRVPILIK
jgi:endonuclease-3